MNRTQRIARVRALFAPSDDPYAGGDLGNACRLGFVLWVIATLFTWVLLPISPPDEAIGGAGWAVAFLTTGLGLVGAREMKRERLSWDAMLVTSYVAIAQIAVMTWLAGGNGTPYAELYLLAALYAGALHPPRRLLGIIAALVAANAAPLAYDGATAEVVGQVGLRVVLLCAAALLCSAVMRTIRAQRINLRERGDVAERLARVDELTALPNRRAFVEGLTTEIARARRFSSPLSLVVADLDSFKQINDTFGHQAGDECLRAVAEVLRSTLRQYDTCFRWGGDEFALLLPETKADEAEVVCRRVATAVAACIAPNGEPLAITCAPAELADSMTPDDLLAVADAALLERKNGPGLRLAHSA
jgi:diguanylate cyclase (GGDEF)-like protein